MICTRGEPVKASKLFDFDEAVAEYLSRKGATLNELNN